MSSRSFFSIRIRWLLLPTYPGVEVLRALAEKQARLMGIEPTPVWVIRNQVCLSCELRHPEAVIGVGGKQFQERRCGMSGVTHGDVEFVRGNDAELGIPKFPPKLMPDCGHLHSLRGPWRVLDRVNHSRSR